MNTLPKQHLGTFMVFFSEEGAFAFYNADTRAEAERMFSVDHPEKTIITTQTVEENLRAVCASEETFQRIVSKFRR